MSRKAIREFAPELRDWLSNMDHRTEAAQLYWRILASLPGGDEAEGLGYKPIDGLGWKEAELLAEMIDAIDDKADVEELVELLADDGEEEDDGEEYEDDEELASRVLRDLRVALNVAEPAAPGAPTEERIGARVRGHDLPRALQRRPVEHVVEHQDPFAAVPFPRARDDLRHGSRLLRVRPCAADRRAVARRELARPG